MRLIHECMGLPASPPVTSEESEVDGDSPPPSRLPVPIQTSVQSQPTVPSQQQQQQQQQEQQVPIQLQPKQDQSMFNPQLITIDERTLQLHFTPLYFGKKYHFPL